MNGDVAATDEGNPACICRYSFIMLVDPVNHRFLVHKVGFIGIIIVPCDGVTVIFKLIVPKYYAPGVIDCMVVAAEGVIFDFTSSYVVVDFYGIGVVGEGVADEEVSFLLAAEPNLTCFYADLIVCDYEIFDCDTGSSPMKIPVPEPLPFSVCPAPSRVMPLSLIIMVPVMLPVRV